MHLFLVLSFVFLKQGIWSEDTINKKSSTAVVQLKEKVAVMHGFLLYRIRHKSIQVVAEGIGLDYACNVFVSKKIEHFADSQIGSSVSLEDSKERWYQGKKSWTSKICKKAAINIFIY